MAVAMASSSTAAGSLLCKASASSRSVVARQACRSARTIPIAPFLLPSIDPHRRYQSTSPASASKRRDKERYNFNTSLSFTADPDPDHVNWRRVTASELVSRKEPPTRVKMLVRDFIDDSLYNPQYGYFSKNVTIFTPPKEGFNFTEFRDTAAFQEAVAERYEREYGRIPTQGGSGLGRQVWHTPTELFKPYYAQSLISGILQSYKLNHFPHEDLILYEVGAGNGSFMIDSLTFIRDNHPDIFARTKYKIIEISTALAQGQRKRAEEEGLGDKVEVINSDFFKWEGGGKEACFVVALEVFDNFAHDMIRYDLTTLTPLQAVVGIDVSGDFSLIYEPVTDPLIRRVLAYQRLLAPSPSTSPPLAKPLLFSPLLRRLYASLPFAPNLSEPDFVPTKAVMFLERLRERLPAHRLLVADFDQLPDAVEGRNGPVVQTRYGGSMIPCETFLVKQGFFDIFFPTDFELLRDIYSVIMNSPAQRTQQSSENRSVSSSTSPKPKPKPKPKSGSTPQSQSANKSAAASAPASDISPDFFTGVRGFRRRQVNIYPHADFLEKYGGELVGRTKVKDGGNVMLGMYGNAKVMF